MEGKQKKKRLGYVADYCPECYMVEEFEVFRVEARASSNDISPEQGKTVEHIKECTECLTTLPTEISLYQKIVSKRIDSIDYLMMITFPNLKEVYDEIYEAEKMAREDPSGIPKDMRDELIREPFLVLNEIISKQHSTELDWKSGSGCLLTLIVPFAGAGLLDKVFNDGDIFSFVFFPLFIIGTIITLYLIFSKSGRKMKREILPLLARALKPYKPSRDDILDCLAKMKRKKIKIAGKVKVKKLLLLINDGE